MTDSIHLSDEGFHEGLPVMMGLEIGRRYHHYLTFDLDTLVQGEGLPPQAVIDRVNRRGGFGFLAHPFEKGMSFKEHSIAYTWNDTSVSGFTGICIWNFASRFKERIKGPLHGLFFLLLKARMLKGPSSETLSFWDELCQSRRVVAIGGSDTHGAVFRLGRFQFTPLPYAYSLNSINVHVLLKSPLPATFAEAKSQIYDALREGRLFIAHDRLAPARGFDFHFESDEGNVVRQGQEGMFHEGTFFIRSPKRAEIRLIKDGALLKRWLAGRVSFRAAQKGVYRVEVYIRVPFFGLRPWIFSNPIYLR
ncbi:MAG: hypothetical protein U5R49_03185 [Deltaproteobacteria bacterium]|nr:hypothetical protein [Deltaproteobacteria bacterium]